MHIFFFCDSVSKSVPLNLNMVLQVSPGCPSSVSRYITEQALMYSTESFINDLALMVQRALLSWPLIEEDLFCLCIVEICEANVAKGRWRLE